MILTVPKSGASNVLKESLKKSQLGTAFNVPKS